jgi:hypothetical protein
LSVDTILPPFTPPFLGEDESLNFLVIDESLIFLVIDESLICVDIGSLPFLGVFSCFFFTWPDDGDKVFPSDPPSHVFI